MDTQPGDMFVVRNAGNFIPHARLFGQDNSAAMAGIELALKECNVEHLVVCGHSNCKVSETHFENLDQILLVLLINNKRKIRTC